MVGPDILLETFSLVEGIIRISKSSRMADVRVLKASFKTDEFLNYLEVGGIGGNRMLGNCFLLSLFLRRLSLYNPYCCWKASYSTLI